MLKIFSPLLLLLFIVSAHANTPSLYTSEQVLTFKRISKVIASPDGKQVAYVTVARKKQTPAASWMYTLYLRAADGNTKLLTKSHMITALSWSPDGKQLTFITKGSKSSGIVVIDIAHPQSNKIMEFGLNITAYKWSPNGKYIALLATGEKPNINAARLLDIGEDHTHSYLYLVSMTTPTPKLQQLPLASDTISQNFNWAPDNQALVFAYQPRPGSSYTNESKIAILNITSGKIIPIPYTEIHVGIQPFYSPNGQWIAFQTNLEGNSRERTLLNDVELNDKVCVTNTNTLATHCLTNTFNDNPVILGWNQQSDQVIVIEEYKTHGYGIYALSLDASKNQINIANVDGFIEPLTVSLNQSGTVLGFGYETAQNAPEAFISKLQPFKLEQVSHLQSSKQSILGKIETLHWRAQDGKEIEGLLITPPHYSKQKKYPLLLTVHGGPAGVWSKRYLGGCDEYETMVDPTSCWGNLLSLGFVILAPNPRGSTGYGKDFRAANYADFGGGDYHDIMSGVDFLINNGVADPNHLAITGWSFGGYMTAWAITQSDRFKAAVDGAGNTDFISFSGTSDIPYYYVKYLGSTFWDNNKLYLQRAPISFVKNIKTPLLILHGEGDFRVPISQSFELYTALRQLKRPVKLVVLPQQGHVPTDPAIIAESIQKVDEWLKQAL